MKKHSCVVSAKVERRGPKATQVMLIRSPNPRPMATRLDMPKPAEVTPTAPVIVEYPRTEPLLDLREVAMAIIMVIAAIWRVWG